LVAAALAGSVALGLYYSSRSRQEDLNIQNKRKSIQTNNSNINSNKDILATVEGKMLQSQHDFNRINRLINNQNQSYLITKKQANILLLEAKNIVPSTVLISRKNIGLFSSVTTDEEESDQSWENYCNIS
jgi:aminoglycoside N3'-acetyltransferase